MKRLTIFLSIFTLNISCSETAWSERYEPKEFLSFESEGYLWEYTKTESIWTTHRDVSYDSKRQMFAIHAWCESSVLDADSNTIIISFVFDSIQNIEDFKLDNLRYIRAETLLDFNQTPTYDNIETFEFNASHFDPHLNFAKTNSRYGSINADFSFRLFNQLNDTITITNGMLAYEYFK